MLISMPEEDFLANIMCDPVEDHTMSMKGLEPFNSPYKQ